MGEKEETYIHTTLYNQSEIIIESQTNEILIINIIKAMQFKQKALVSCSDQHATQTHAHIIPGG